MLLYFCVSERAILKTVRLKNDDDNNKYKNKQRECRRHDKLADDRRRTDQVDQTHRQGLVRRSTDEGKVGVVNVGKVGTRESARKEENANLCLLMKTHY